MITVTRYHDFSAGHRVAGHEGKCANLHGHNYRAHFTVGKYDYRPNRVAKNNALDELGRVVDFGFIKTTLCDWLEDNWDHKFLIWEADPVLKAILETDSIDELSTNIICDSFVQVPFNPTAENMAQYLLNQIAPPLLSPFDCYLKTIRIEETRKCSAEYSI